MKKITLEDAIHKVAIAKERVHQIESQVISAKGGIPCGAPGMQGFDTIQECIRELYSLKMRFEKAEHELASLNSLTNTELAEEVYTIMETFSDSPKGLENVYVAEMMSHYLDSAQIKSIALAAGFELKDCDGIMDLRPYVYSFAHGVSDACWAPRPIEFSYVDGKILHPKDFPFDGSTVLLCYAGGWSSGHWVPQDGHGEDAEGFSWFIDHLGDDVPHDDVIAYLPQPIVPFVEVVDGPVEEEEPSPAVKATWNKYVDMRSER